MERNKQAALEQAGKRLRQERQRLGLSQKDLAQRVGLTREMWGRYERGMVEVNQHVLAQFVELGARARFLEGEIALPTGRISADNVREALDVLAGAMEQMQLNEDELRLLAWFRVADPARKQILLELACASGKVAGGAMG